MIHCEDCWREATIRHANGMGEGESVTEVYGDLVEANWCKTERGRRVIDMRGKDRQEAES